MLAEKQIMVRQLEHVYKINNNNKKGDASKLNKSRGDENKSSRGMSEQMKEVCHKKTYSIKNCTNQRYLQIIENNIEK